MAGQRSLTLDVGARLLASKLAILNGTAGTRGPSAALSLLTGATPAFVGTTEEHTTTGRRYMARTVYLAQSHLTDIDRIIDAWEQTSSRRLNRSVVLRRAVEQLRTLVEAQSPLLLENE